MSWAMSGLVKMNNYLLKMILIENFFYRHNVTSFALLSYKHFFKADIYVNVLGLIMWSVPVDEIGKVDEDQSHMIIPICVFRRYNFASI